MNGPFTIKTDLLRHRTGLMLTLAAALAVTSYLLASRLIFRIGFPLDDAWIHQTYARNLAQLGEWSFVPGQISAGSTSPLWTVLLAAGYIAGLMPYLWTYFLGFICLGGLAWIGERAFQSLQEGIPNRFPWFGLFLVGEWHLVWAAASGMETLLFAVLILSSLMLLITDTRRIWIAGALAGLAVWVRPDGLTLLGPLLFVIFLEKSSLHTRLIHIGQSLGAFLLFFLPYLVFNRLLAGSFWPNTFYAKQAEYAAMLQIPLLERLATLYRLPLVGAGVLLLPGVIYSLWQAYRRHSWAVLAAFLWWAGYTLIYALRLPVSYQHGRYLIPSMPVFDLLGFAGTVMLVRLGWHMIRTRLWVRAWAASIVAVWLLFFGLGAWTYGQDVAIIETEMVETARWADQNLPPDALIAAHDIGALGYFASRPLVDLAGLVTPEVIPFIRDEAALATYLDQRGAAYLITFPGWYPGLIQYGQPIFTSQGSFAPREQGGENMVVYRWLGK